MFNSKAKAGSEEELVWAELVEDIEEKEVDDIETNKTADPEADWNASNVSNLNCIYLWVISVMISFHSYNLAEEM